MTNSSLNLNVSKSASVPGTFGQCQVSSYKEESSQKEHVLCVFGELGDSPILRIHSECFTGDILGSFRCDCGQQLQDSLSIIKEAGSGILIYLRQEGRNIGLGEKMHAYLLQDQGYDTLDANLELGHQADERDYSIAIKMLRDLGVNSVRLISNNPEKIKALEDANIKLQERIKLHVETNPLNEKYVKVKKERFRHHYE